METIRWLREKIDKAEMQQMPTVSFPGRIVVVQTVAEAEKAVAFLRMQTLVGFDTETRPSFKKGHNHKVALMQISVHDLCFLFRLNMIGMPPVVCDFLSDSRIRKVGLSLKDDFMMLHERTQVTLSNFIDLQQYVKTFGIKDMSLQKLYANLFGKRISKTQQLSNWEADVLTDRQKQYAAIDAWACLMLYEELERLKVSGEYRILPVEN